MKKRFISMAPVLIFVAILALAGSIYAAGAWSTSSGVLDTSGVLASRPAGLCGITVHTSGVSAITVNLHDGSSTSGVSKWSITVPAADYYGGKNFTPPLQFFNGIYFSVSGTGGTAVIEYIQQQ